MKSFFKKLSLVLVAAMVITMLPAQSAKAATKITLGIKGQKEAALANTAQTYEMKVGEKQLWAFWGVDSYNTAGGKTKNWTSSNPAVATVANGEITAVTAGKTKITLTLTNNGIDYIGQADLTVVDKNAAPTAGESIVKQVAWNMVEITFDTPADAKAAIDAKIDVTRVRTDKNGREIYLYSGASFKQKTGAKNIVQVGNLSNGITYRFVIPGVKTPVKVTMSAGEPAAVKLSYETAYIAPNDKIVYDISGNDIRRPQVEPTAVVVDANDIIVDSSEGTFKYSTDKSRNTGSVQLYSNGTVKINSANGSCYVKCEYSYKNSEGKTIPVDYDEITVVPVPYTAPNFQGFVEQITLTDTDGTDVVYPSDYSYTSEIAIGQTLNLAFYFETPDGDKYVPAVVKNTVKGSGLRDASEQYKDIVPTNNNVYAYRVVKDNDKLNRISISSLDGKVAITGFAEGKQTICVYELGPDSGDDVDPNKDKLVGILNIDVKPKAEIVDLHLSENSVSGFSNTNIVEDSVIFVKYELEDQYGNKTAANVKVRDENGGVPQGVAITEKKSTDGYYKNLNKGGETLIRRGYAEGYIAINTSEIEGADKGKTLVVSVDDQADPCRDTLYVTTKKIEGTKSGYSLMAGDVTVKNKNVRTLTDATNLKLKIDVVNTKGGDRLDPWKEFWVVGDANLGSTKVTAANVGRLFVVITKEDGTVLKQDLNENVFPLVSEVAQLGTNVTKGCWIPATGALVRASNIAVGSLFHTNKVFELDLIKNGNPQNLMTDSTFLKGKFIVTLYEAKTVNEKYKQLESIELNVNDNLTRISDVNKLYKIEASTAETAKGKPVVVEVDGVKTPGWDGNYGHSVNVEQSTALNALVMTIVGDLWTWIDIDSNGKCVSDDGKSTQGGEIKQIKTLVGLPNYNNLIAETSCYAEDKADGTGFVKYSLNYVPGPAGSNEIYISDVTIRFRISTGALVEQKLDINTKYTFKEN